MRARRNAKISEIRAFELRFHLGRNLFRVDRLLHFFGFRITTLTNVRHVASQLFEQRDHLRDLGLRRHVHVERDAGSARICAMLTILRREHHGRDQQRRQRDHTLQPLEGRRSMARRPDQISSKISPTQSATASTIKIKTARTSQRVREPLHAALM